MQFIKCTFDFLNSFVSLFFESIMKTTTKTTENLSHNPSDNYLYTFCSQFVEILLCRNHIEFIEVDNFHFLMLEKKTVHSKFRLHYFSVATAIGAAVVVDGTAAGFFQCNTCFDIRFSSESIHDLDLWMTWIDDQPHILWKFRFIH